MTGRAGVKIGVLGAGAIGSYVGGALVAGGDDVVLVGRRPLSPEVEAAGLTLGDLDGGTRRVDVAAIAYRTSSAALADRDVVLCCVKSGQTAQAAADLRGALAPGAVVVSFQNGMGNADTLRAGLPGVTVLAGIVGFNVVAGGPGVYRHTTSGPLVIEASADERVVALAGALRAAGFEVRLAGDVRALQWAKLLLNLNNAVSALSGRPTQELLLEPGYRRVLAAILAEALRVMRAAGIRPASLTGMPVTWAPRVLALPTFLLRAVLRTQIKIDPEARSSMWEDLSKGRPTEVDHLNGEIVRLAEASGGKAPVNRRVVELVHEHERRGAGSPQLSAAQMWSELGASVASG